LGRTCKRAICDLPHKGSERQGHGLPEFRTAEDGVKGAQSSWKLFTIGSVGSQALLGIARLHQLVSRFPDIHLWPFDGPIPPAFNGVVLAEIFPSIFALGQDDLLQQFPDQAYHIKDAVQVRTVDRGVFTGATRGLGCRLSK
jgi:hypothetical protein